MQIRDFDQFVSFAKEYYELISRDHHKDRDCHWSIEANVSAYADPRTGEHVTFTVSHGGYIDNWDREDITFQSMREALAYATSRLRADIEDARRWDPDGMFR